MSKASGSHSLANAQNGFSQVRVTRLTGHDTAATAAVALPPPLRPLLYRGLMDRETIEPATATPRPSTQDSSLLLLQIAGVVFVVGLLAIVALFVTPLLDHGGTAPTWVYLLTMCAPLGFLLGLIYALRAGRGRR